MIDEAQETDLRQWAILRALSTTSGAAFDAENVFVVGDTKQSINLAGALANRGHDVLAVDADS